METIMIGALVALLILVSFFAGVRIGTKLVEGRQPASRPEEPSEEEQRRIMEDQRAFETMLQYNIDDVYGLKSVPGGGMNES